MNEKNEIKKTLEILEENKLKVGEFIKDMRLRANLSLAQLADISGIFASDIHKIERGEKNKINPFQLKALGEALSIDYKRLYTMVGYLDSEDSKKNNATVITWYEEPSKVLWFHQKKFKLHIILEKTAKFMNENASKKILLIDMSKNLNLFNSVYNSEPEYKNTNFLAMSNIDFFVNFCDIKSSINSLKYYDLAIIHSESDLGNSTNYTYNYGREKRLKDALEKIKSEYDFIFINTTSFNLETVNSFVSSDKIIIGYKSWEEETDIVSNIFDFVRCEKYLKVGKFYTLATSKLETEEFKMMLSNNRLCSKSGFLRIKEQINYDEFNNIRKEDFYIAICNEILTW